MGFRVTIKGKKEDIILEKDSILGIKYISDTPNDSNARATDLSVGLDISGKITNDKEDNTKKLCVWSLISAEEEEAYKDVSLEVISAGTVIRKINFPNTFIVDYTENYDVKNGNGIFNLTLKQKKEKISSIIIEGGYNAV